ncbi:MAG: glutamate--tRNA ligase [Thermodesulfobacteriota bacterium]
MTVRTRFAPSPTGHLHIGGARTALFNWLYARHNKGKFILRIEDTDVARSTEEYTRAILDGMEWLGLDWDEGPFYQSKRSEVYARYAGQLMDRGFAYRCYCTPEELEAKREAALKSKRPPMYDRTCRSRTDQSDLTGRPYALRFRVPDGSTMFKDEIKGVISYENSGIEDLIIVRSDGTPTYNFCVVVDDATMEITHCIRGDDHINNTPKQILMYKALGLTPPVFAHLPMILGADKTRLSKRHGATSVTAYREMGILPEALVNYLARLGWSHGDQEIFSMEELVEKFTLEAVGKSSGVFNPEKLIWLNQHYIKGSTDAELADMLLPFLKERGVDAAGDPRLRAIAASLRERAKTLAEMADSSVYFFTDAVTYDEKAAAKFLTQEKAEILDSLRQRLSGLETFTEEAVEGVFAAILEETGLGLGKVAQPVRVALTGGTVSPGIHELITAMGREMVTRRLAEGAAYCRGRGPA